MRFILNTIGSAFGLVKLSRTTANRTQRFCMMRTEGKYQGEATDVRK